MHSGITDLNIDTAVSLFSNNGTQAQSNAVSRAFATSAATLEASVIEQTQDLPDTA